MAFGSAVTRINQIANNGVARANTQLPALRAPVAAPVVRSYTPEYTYPRTYGNQEPVYDFPEAPARVRVSAPSIKQQVKAAAAANPGKVGQLVSQSAQTAATQTALAQAAAQSYGGGGGGGGYGYGGGGGYGYGGGYSSGYGGGYGGYSGGYSDGGGGSTVTVGGLPIGDVTGKVTGWASRYLPALIPDVLANPATIGRDTISDMGIGGEPLQSRFGDLSTYVSSQLLPILYAQTAMGKMPKGGDVVNRVHDLLTQMATPDGDEIDPMKLLDIVLTEGSKSSKDKQTLGSSLFAGMSPAKQAETMQGLVNNISNWLANPYFAQGMRNWISTQKDDYIGATARAKDTYKDPFAKYLRATALPE